MVREEGMMEGAEAKVYPATVLGIEAVVKERIMKEYRNDLLDRAIREERTRKEARILAVASRNGIAVPSLLLVGRNRIAMTMVKGTLLSELLAVSPGRNRLNGIFAQVGGIAARLHALGINHGDLTPANFIVDDDDIVWAIDFGLSGTDNSVEEFALDLLLMKRSVGKRDYGAFHDSYAKESGEMGGRVLLRLKEIETRGRYQTRTLMV